MVDGNIKGVLNGIAAALPVSRAQGFGHFVHTASTAAYGVISQQAVYAATKPAVKVLTEGIGKGGNASTAAALIAQRDAIGMSPEAIARGVAQHEPDLFWALRGGGGNFGVVTSMRIRLHAAARVVAGTILYPLSQAGVVLSRIQEVLWDSPQELSVDTGFFCTPKGDPVVFALPTWSGDLDRGVAQSGPVHALARLGTPLLAQIGPTLRSAAATESDAAFPAGRMTAIRTRRRILCRADT